MTRQNAILLVVFGAISMSFAALIVRLLETADGFQILGYRGIAQSAVILLMACMIRRLSPGRFFREIDAVDLFTGFLMTGAFCFYIFALLNTSVASALFLLSLSPVMAAILSWIVIKERPSLIVIIAIILALIGIAVMVGEAGRTGRLLGMIFALLSALTFASMLVTARVSSKADVFTGNFLGAFCAMILGFGISTTSYGSGTALPLDEILLCFLLGAGTIGLGIALISIAAPHLPAAEVSLLVLLESVLAPVWVWLFMNEVMTLREIIGGVIILGSVILLTLGRSSE